MHVSSSNFNLVVKYGVCCVASLEEKNVSTLLIPRNYTQLQGI